ncbi:hypothetical protein CNEONATC25_02036 [Clostridium neonatale]|uniref:Uncharacterized protein n=1 Tax=Clostridium neonatale TaxID=137838 RepID=A0A653ARL2_9CLOT|nr:hypothetical protein CNEONATC25_02036 [Clostridium neonatale]VCT84422.1 hypothetical protein CNEONATNEC25_02022 [Clostridium neonatale]
MASLIDSSINLLISSLLCTTYSHIYGVLFSIITFKIDSIIELVSSGNISYIYLSLSKNSSYILPIISFRIILKSLEFIKFSIFSELIKNPISFSFNDSCNLSIISSIFKISHNLFINDFKLSSSSKTSFIINSVYFSISSFILFLLSSFNISEILIFEFSLYKSSISS